MVLINIIGSNAIGKSTRVTTLVDFLDQYDFSVIQYDTPAKGLKEVGKLYETPQGKIFVYGNYQEKKKIWIGLDNAYLSKLEDRLNFMKYMSELGCDTFIQEGYFNNGSKKMTMNEIKDFGISSYKYFFFLYNEVQEYIDRTNGRTGNSRNEDWALNSAGWKNNLANFKMRDFYLEALKKDSGCSVYSLTKDEPKDYFVTKFFNRKHEIKQKEQISIF